MSVATTSSSPSELQMRFAQALPTLFSLALTVCIPWAAKRSLQLWRAVQVYDGQQPATETDNFTYRAPTKAAIWRIALISLWPVVLQLSFYFTAGYDFDAAGWPIIGALRRSMPFILLATILFVTRLILLAPSVVPVTRVSRLMDIKKRCASMLNIDRATVPDPKKTQTNTVAGWTKLAVIAFSSGVTAYVCARAQSSLFVVMLTALCSMAMSFHVLSLPVTMFKTTSLRAHILTIVCILGFMFAFLALCVALGLVLMLIDHKFGLNMLDNHNKSDKSSSTTSGGESTPKGFAAFDTDLPVNQFISLVYILIWYSTVFFPCALITLAYRFDVSQAGWTNVAETDAEQAVIESRHFAEQLQEQRIRLAKPSAQAEIEQHPFDHLGRIPIRLDAPSLLIKSSSRSAPRPSTPTYTATLRTLIVFELAGLLFNMLVLPADFNSPSFPFAQGDLTNSLSISSNFWPLLAYPVLMLVMPISVAFSSRRRGESMGAGLRRLWKYEERWGADYKQASPSASLPPSSDRVASPAAAEEAKPLLCDVDDVEA